MQGFNVESLQEKWNPILNHDGMGDIKDNHRKMVTAVLLENQERMMREEREFLSEAAPTNSTGGSIDSTDSTSDSTLMEDFPIDSTKFGRQQPQCSGESGLSPALSNALMASGAGHTEQASVDLNFLTGLNNLAFPNVSTRNNSTRGSDSTHLKGDLTTTWPE